MESPTTRLTNTPGGQQRANNHFISAFDAVDGSSTGTRVPRKWVLLRPHDLEEPIMQAVRTIGLDIAKSVFQVHGVDADDQVVIRRQLKRHYVLAFFQKMPPCLVGMEACATWSRERLMPPAYAKPYVKRSPRQQCREPRPMSGAIDLGIANNGKRSQRRWLLSRLPTRSHGWPGP